MNKMIQLMKDQKKKQENILVKILMNINCLLLVIGLYLMSIFKGGDRND